MILVYNGFSFIPTEPNRLIKNENCWTNITDNLFISVKPSTKPA